MLDAKLIKIDKNGTKYYEGMVKCPRCGGHGGSNAWAYTGWTCYQCNGSGSIPSKWKEYTPEYEAKLNANRAKRAEKKHNEDVAYAKAHKDEYASKFFSSNGFNDQGTTWVVLGNTYKIKDELKEKGAKFNPILGWHFDHMEAGYQLVTIDVEEIAERNVFYKWNFKECAYEIVKRIVNDSAKVESKSNYVGEIGQKMKDVELKLISTYGYETTAFNGYGTTYVKIYSFEDKDENVIVWKTSSFNEIGEGKTYIASFTIKDHKEYKDVKQTIVKNMKFGG